MSARKPTLSVTVGDMPTKPAPRAKRTAPYETTPGAQSVVQPAKTQKAVAAIAVGRRPNLSDKWPAEKAAKRPPRKKSISMTLA